MNEPLLTYIRRRLENFRGQWRQISDETGLPYDTIAKLSQGRRPNPELATIQPLLDWFSARDEMVARLSKDKAAAS